jgi:hypothetical protein
MKKEEIYVVIDSEQTRQRAIEILERAGEIIDYSNFELSDILIVHSIDKDWFLTEEHFKKSKQEITLDQLEQMLLPKQGYICPQTKIQCDDECCVSAEDCHITSSLDSGIVDCEPEQETLGEYDITGNQIMHLKEDIECVHMYLDDLELPRADSKGEEYSIVGRIKRLEERMYSDEELKHLLYLFLEHVGEKQKRTILNVVPNEWFEKFKKK